MTFLDLVQALRSQAGQLGTGPASVLNRSGMEARLVSWVQLSYEALLGQHPWQFLWRRGSTVLPAGQADFTELPGLDSVGLVYRDSVRDTSSFPSKRVPFLPWVVLDHMREQPESAAPRNFSRRPDGALSFYPTPDVDAPIQLDYLIRPPRLAADGDVPLMPADLHMLIVWEALLSYAYAEADPDALNHARFEHARLYDIMATRYLPRLTGPVTLDTVPAPDLPELL